MPHLTSQAHPAHLGRTPNARHALHASDYFLGPLVAGLASCTLLAGWWVVGGGCRRVATVGNTGHTSSGETDQSGMPARSIWVWRDPACRSSAADRYWRTCVVGVPCAFPRWRRVRGAIGFGGRGIGRGLVEGASGPLALAGVGWGGKGRGTSLLRVGGFNSMMPPWGLGRGFCRGRYKGGNTDTGDRIGGGRRRGWHMAGFTRSGRPLLALLVQCQAASPLSNPVPNCTCNAYPGEATGSFGDQYDPLHPPADHRPLHPIPRPTPMPPARCGTASGAPRTSYPINLGKSKEQTTVE